MVKDYKLQHLAGVPLFAGADRKQLDRIAGCCTEVRLSPGQVLCRQGGVARELILVDEGHASAQVDGRLAYELGPGDVVGGIAVLSAQRYAATVVASTSIRVLTLTRAEVCAVLDAAPMLAVRLLRTVAVRESVTVPPQPRDGRVGASSGACVAV